MSWTRYFNLVDLDCENDLFIQFLNFLRMEWSPFLYYTRVLLKILVGFGLDPHPVREERRVKLKSTFSCI